jgi:hypothetical protein
VRWDEVDEVKTRTLGGAEDALGGRQRGAASGAMCAQAGCWGERA